MKDIDWNRMAFFAALCFFLSAVEYAVPKPLPFFRIGFTNIPVMLSLSVMKKKETAVLIFLKIILQAVMSGTLFSYVFVFSFVGSVASGFFMMLIHSVFGKKISWIGISVCGGFANNIAQLVFACFFIFGQNVRFIAPAMLSVALPASVALGVFSEIFCRDSVWYRTLIYQSPVPLKPVSEKKKNINVFSLLISIAAFFILLAGNSVFEIYGVLLIFLVLLFIKKEKVRIAPSFILIFFITFFSLLNPHGRILFSVAGFNITSGALCSGLVKGGKLCSFVFVSRFLISRNIRIPGKAGQFFVLVTGYFSRLTESGFDFNRKNLMSRIDSRLCKVWNGVY